MQTAEKIEQLHVVVNELLGRESLNYLTRFSAPIDIDRPNDHDNKTEFLLELQTVNTCIKNLSEIFERLIEKDEAEGMESMRNRLKQNLDAKARAKAGKVKVENVSDLITKNIADTGFSNNSLMAMVKFYSVLTDRRKELDDQENEFWTINHRPPNYYARTIALRLARLYAKELDKKPTFGTSGDGGHPSTAFGRALSKVFGVLEINADIRSPAEWAIDQLTDEDLKAPSSRILEGLLPGIMRGSNPVSNKKAHLTLADVLAKESNN